MAKSDWDPDYKLPGNKVVNLCLFWATNYKINSTLKTIEQAEKRFKEHNIGININPSRNYTKSHIIDVGDEAIPPQDYDKLRRKAAAVFDDLILVALSTHTTLFSSADCNQGPCQAYTGSA